MPSCCVENCRHNSHGSLRLFRFPTDTERRKKWAVNCGRVNWFPTDSTRICEAHFDESQFEHNRQDGRKLLKWNAFPTLFNNSSWPKRTVTRNFWENKDSEDKTSPEPTNGTEGTTGSVHDTTKASAEGGKTTAKLRSFNTRGILTDCDQFEELDVIAAIEKMGHEVQSEICHVELNLQDGKKVAKDMVRPPGTKTKSSKRTVTVKECSPKRKKLHVLESHDEATEERVKAQQKVGKLAEMTYMPQGEAEDLEDELAQIKAEIKKLMYEADVEDSNMFEIKELPGSRILESTDTPAICSMSNLPTRLVSVKKKTQNGVKVEENSNSCRSVFIPCPVSTEATDTGSCKRLELVGNCVIISGKSQCLPVEVGIQTDNLKEWEEIPRLKAEVELLKHQLVEKDRKIHQFEQRLAAILQPGHTLLLQKSGSSLSEAKKYVILSRKPNNAADEKVS